MFTQNVHLKQSDSSIVTFDPEQFLYYHVLVHSLVTSYNMASPKTGVE